MDDENGGRLREYGLGAGQGAIETHDYFVVPHGHQVSFCYIYLYYGSYIAEEMDWTGLDLLDDVGGKEKLVFIVGRLSISTGKQSGRLGRMGGNRHHHPPLATLKVG